jgi:hypothetical protein
MGAVAMDAKSFSLLDKVFNITQYNRGKLGEVAKIQEKEGEGNWYFIQTGQSISSVIVPLQELKKLVDAYEKLEKLQDYAMYIEAAERLNSNEKTLEFTEVMTKIGLNPDDVVSLEDTVEFE